MAARRGGGLVAWRLDVVAGGLAGLLAGLVVGWLEAAQGMMAGGFATLTATAPGWGVYLAFAGLVGAGFGGLFGYQPGGHAATLGAGLVAGLLSWVLGPLTLLPLLAGQAPTWSLAAATAAFPYLVGALLYGGLTGVGLHLLAAAWLAARPAPAAVVPPPPTARVVVLGGGFGGVAAAQQLERDLARQPGVEVALVSQSNYLLFTPMLAEVAASSLEARHISAPVRAACRSTRFVRAEVQAIDPDARVVTVQAGPSAPAEALLYEHLVLALGAVPDYRGLPGMAEHAIALKTLEDATRLRDHVLGLLELADAEPDPTRRAQQLTFVVAGGGFAGTELVAELFDLVHSVLHYYPSIGREEPRFVLVHSRGRILPELGPELAGYALDRLQARGIRFRLSTRVAGATPDAMLLEGGGRIPTRTLVWTAGNRPNPILGMLPAERTPTGAVVVDPTLRVAGLDGVWAIGDCAAIPTPQGGTYPPTAQHALREGRLVARNVAAALRGRPPKPFRFRTIGTLVALGHRSAAAELRGRRFSGLLAWLMWRAVYLAKLPGFERKARVLLDWTIDLFLPRDIVLTQPPPDPTLPEQVRAGRRERAG
jgi:NADH:ubiquinone reductase (H+-translocating)